MPLKIKKEYNAYMAKYMLNRYHKRREKILELLGNKCNKCGSVKHLEIDHINPKTKNFNIAKMWSVSKTVFADELNKCQLLCHTCHADKTKSEEHWKNNPNCQPRLVHGSRWTYKHHKCRCAKCVEGYELYNAQRRIV